MKKILIAVSAFALFAAVSGVARADDAKAPAPTTKTSKKTTKTEKAADGTATTDTKTETKKEAPAKK